MFNGQAKILCDENIILRRHSDGFKIYGTWIHGEVPNISGDSVPLKAIFLLHKARVNCIQLVKDKQKINKRLLPCLMRSFVTAESWHNILSLIEKTTNEIPCYLLYFDKSGKIVSLLKQFCKSI